MHLVRRATEEDLSKVVRLSELWASENITHGLTPNSLNDLKPELGDYFFVANNDSETIGYIYGTVHINEGTAVISQGEKYLEIDEVYVHPDYRDDGIGHELVEQLLDEAERQGIKRSVVYSATKQWQKIVGFYEKHGFQMWFVQMYK